MCTCATRYRRVTRLSLADRPVGLTAVVERSDTIDPSKSINCSLSKRVEMNNPIEISVAEELLFLIDSAIEKRDIKQLTSIYGIVHEFIGKPIYDPRADFVIIDDYIYDLIDELEAGKEPTIYNGLRKRTEEDLHSSSKS